MDPLAHKRLVIAGINGQFGRILARKLAQAGARISGIDLQESVAEPSICQSYVCSSITDMTEACRRMIADAEYVLLCLPEEPILEALPQLCALLREDALLMDTASVKTQISEVLARVHAQVGYLSIHPLFGPMEDFTGRTICVIPMRENAKVQHFITVIERWGASVVRLTTAEEHDSITAWVQVLPHAALIAFGATLANSRVPFDRLWSIATPIQKIMMALTARIVSREHDTYWTIQSANSSAAMTRDKLEAEIKSLSAIVLKSEWPEFTERLSSIERYFGNTGATLEELASRCVDAAAKA